MVDKTLILRKLSTLEDRLMPIRLHNRFQEDMGSDAFQQSCAFEGGAATIVLQMKAD